jgi:hypothetical protein
VRRQSSKWVTDRFTESADVPEEVMCGSASSQQSDTPVNGEV